MATNKHATIRYHAIDRCFGNFGRRFYIDDLITACNDALYDYTGVEEGIKRRQIFEDIKFMESEQGWSIPLERCKDGKRVFYKYEDSEFSIKNQAINELEANQLKETINILNRFKGMPQFEWMEELLVRMETSFHLNRSDSVIVGFEQNPYLKGLNFFSDLFNAIQFKKVLNINYQGFKQETATVSVIHPYYLKQFNNRWFLFGFNQTHEKISNLALDRIVGITETTIDYIENSTIDFEEYFDDVIGVSVASDGMVERVLLKIDNQLFPYIQTKPIHGSQKVIERSEFYTIIELKIIPNYEFESIILSYGEKIEVLSPINLREVIQLKVENLANIYEK